MIRTSVIIPYHNAENYIRYCVESVLNQTYEKIELLMINLGSTDNSMNIVKEYSAKDSRIKMVQRAYDDFASAKNQGLQFVKGEYVLFMNPRDTMHPDFLSSVMKIANQSNADIVVTPTGINKGCYDKALLDNQYELDKTILMRAILKDELKSNLYGKLIKRSLFNAIKFKEEKPAEDLGIMYLLFDKSNSIAYEEVEGYISHIGLDNADNKKSDFRKLTTKLSFYLDRHEFSKEFYPGLTEDTFDLAIYYGISIALTLLNEKPENWKDHWKAIRHLMLKYEKEIEGSKNLSKLEKKVAKYIISDNLTMSNFYSKIANMPHVK